MSTVSQNMQHELEIEFVFGNQKNRFFKFPNHLVQSHPVRFGLQIKNIDTKPNCPGKISNLSIKSSEGNTVVHTADEVFALPVINPGDKITLWWPEKLNALIKGVAWVDCNIIPDMPNVEFKTFQFDRLTGVRSKGSRQNAWGNALIIRGDLEEQQSITNLLILILTILVFLDGVWGLKDIFYWLAKELGGWFILVGNSFLKIKFK
jgi:hypothetical protein